MTASSPELTTARLGAAALLDVSVVIPLYNKANYVARAVRSALDQTLPPREVVVVDDGSTDGGTDIVERLAADDACVRLIRQANAGPSAARNRGIAEARGKWIAFLDADDMLLPRHLETAAEMAACEPAAAVLAAAYREVPEGDHQRVAAALAEERAAVTTGRVSDFFERWQQGAFFFTSSVLVRRDQLEQMQPVFPLGEKLGEDHDVWFRLVERVPVAWTSKVGALYTVGLDQSLTGVGRVLDPLPAYQRLKARAESDDFPKSQRASALNLVATHWLNIARVRADAGDAAGARSLILAPISLRRPLYWARTALVVATTAIAGRPVRLGRL
ncbi:MAG: glycosyltransferase family A protein [Hyphomicrobiaceae bacterium]